MASSSSSLMAYSSSSFMTGNYTYNVFPSFRGPDVRKTLLSHLREQFKRNGITMFNDGEIVRGETIAPSLKDAIKESRIAIVILSKKYASSSWCLDELVEILNCKEVMGQIVMTIFYGVEPSHVRNQTGEFGITFSETCALKTDEDRQKWSKALTEVANIEGEDFLRWDSEAKMIQKIAKDVSERLNATPSRDFDGMVGLEAHLRKMESLLDLDYDGVKIVAITGPAGIGKTTVARALHSILSNRFQLTCFVDNLREIYHSGFDEYGLKLRLQEQLLSKILNQNGIRICHLGVIEERLCRQRVLIILDDVNHIKQLEALANETTWFGPRSRIIVTTENNELLQQHKIQNIYHMGFPSDEEALEILCRYAFRQRYPRDGFEELTDRITKLCGKLPLGLRVVGKSLREKSEDEWENVISRLDIILDREIEDVLRVGYETLDENEQTLFLHIAIFFNYQYGDLVKTMFTDSDLDVKRGLKILLNRSLIEIFTYDGEIVMHKLLQQLAKQVIHKQKPWKRQILRDAHEICDVLENETGTGAVSGISFDISGIDELHIGKKAFKRMFNLRFLSVYKSKYDGNDIMHIPEGMEFPRRLKLLQWEAYPRKCLPPTFRPEYLVKLDMRRSQLEYLWQGTQKLKNLKEMDLSESYHLKELPDLSNATNLETLDLSDCGSLVEIPSSCSHLHKLETLWLNGCRNLEVIPDHLNLASLEVIYMDGCPKLRNFPMISTHIKDMFISEGEVEDVPASISLCSRLKDLTINNNKKLKRLTHLPMSLGSLKLTNCDIERIPDCIKSLHQLQRLDLSGCRRLASLPELPSSLKYLCAVDCESLETIFHPFNFPCRVLEFNNCFKLGKQARRAIIRRSITHKVEACLPGRQVPRVFNHRARGNSLTIPLNGKPLPRNTDFVVCVVVSLNQTRNYEGSIYCRVVKDGVIDEEVELFSISNCFRKEHVFICCDYWFGASILGRSNKSPQVKREILFEFSSENNNYNLIECGVQIRERNDSVTSGSNESGPSEAFEDQVSENDHNDDDWSYDEFEPSVEVNLQGENRIDCWSWLILCFNLSDIARNIRSLVSERRRENI